MGRESLIKGKEYDVIVHGAFQVSDGTEYDVILLIETRTGRLLEAAVHEVVMNRV